MNERLAKTAVIGLRVQVFHQAVNLTADGDGHLVGLFKLSRSDVVTVQGQIELGPDFTDGTLGPPQIIAEKCFRATFEALCNACPERNEEKSKGSTSQKQQLAGFDPSSHSPWRKHLVRSGHKPGSPASWRSATHLNPQTVLPSPQL